MIFRFSILISMENTRDENLFKRGTKQLALRCIGIVEALPKTADVIAKLRIVEEEADELATG